ncbi:MAG: hypothetical protein KDC87_17070 [Planctomycetes bacterium]|nr:hypothetical protein [Planctomycetota bacterium]MCB9872176.1 hypothetical protein [Planctomycetota bacterium]
MQRLPSHLVPLALALAAAVPAQTTFTSPPGLDQQTGGGASWGVGAYAAGRSQLADGHWRGNPLILRELALRLRSPTSGYFEAGRSWTQVSLSMSETSIATFSGTFSSNLLRPATLVFQAAVSWPFVTGPHQSVPAPWAYRFPFTTPWVYTGGNDILADWDFTGGTLTNQQSWGTTVATYQFDTVPTAATAYATGRDLGNTGSAGCRDSTSTIPTLSSRTALTVAVHHPLDRANPLAGQMVVSQLGSQFGPNTQVLSVVGLRSFDPGIPFPGVPCNGVHIDTRVPFLWSTVPSTNVGALPEHWTLTGRGGVPFQSAWVGQEIVVQGAWNDTASRVFLLSSASRTTVPTAPTFDAKLAALHAGNTVSGTPQFGGVASPVRRYTR